MATKKAAKKGAKKAASKHASHKPEKDARRTFEHLGRVQAIQSLAAVEQERIGLLVATADGAFRNKLYKDSADLLRAAEHLCFSSIVETESGRVSGELILAIHEEFNHLLERSEEHGGAAEAPKNIRKIYQLMAKEAEEAVRNRSYRRGLELARGAEALSHVHELDEKLLGACEPQKMLGASR